jgi:hypothetical protein
MATSAVDDAMNALQTQLAARPGLAGVTVASGDLDADTPREAIILGGVFEWEQEWATIGNLRKDEDFGVETVVWIVKPGAGETVIRAARDRAVAIVAEIETYLRLSTVHGDAVDGITLQGVVRSAEWRPTSLRQGPYPDGGRWCQVTGVIGIKARLPR